MTGILERLLDLPLPPIRIQLADPRPTLLGLPGTASSTTISGQLTMRMIPSYTQMEFSQARVSLVQTTRIKKVSGTVKGLALRGHKVGLKPAIHHVASQEDIVIARVELIESSVHTSAPVISLDREITSQASTDFELTIPGDLSATTKTSIGSVSYTVVATAVLNSKKTLQTSAQICVQRVIPHSSSDNGVIFLRRYPDTGLMSKLIGPVCVDPMGTFQFQMTLSGTETRGEQTTSFLRVDELVWRVDEIVRIISMSNREVHDEPSRSGKDVVQHLTRPLGVGKCTKWVNGEDAQIKIDFDVALPQKVRTACDLKLCLRSLLEQPIAELPRAGRESQRLGMTVSHVLVVELAMILDVYENGSGKRMDLNPWRRRTYGATYDLRIAQRVLGEDIATDMSAENESLPMYSDSLSGRPPGYDALPY